jgi:hypothetical protein
VLEEDRRAGGRPLEVIRTSRKDYVVVTTYAVTAFSLTWRGYDLSQKVRIDSRFRFASGLSTTRNGLIIFEVRIAAGTGEQAFVMGVTSTSIPGHALTTRQDLDRELGEGNQARVVVALEQEQQRRLALARYVEASAIPYIQSAPLAVDGLVLVWLSRNLVSVLLPNIVPLVDAAEIGSPFGVAPRDQERIDLGFQLLGPNPSAELCARELASQLIALHDVFSKGLNRATIPGLMGLPEDRELYDSRHELGMLALGVIDEFRGHDAFPSSDRPNSEFGLELGIEVPVQISVWISVLLGRLRQLKLF